MPVNDVRIKVGVMGSADEDSLKDAKASLSTTAIKLAQAIVKRDLLLLTGATTGLVYLVGKTARDTGAFHIGISPAANRVEHVEAFHLPLDACDAILYTGFGLKGRNVVLVRSCDIVLFIAGSMGSLNEFTIAHDEGKVIGCVTKTGGVANQVSYLLQEFSKETGARVFENDDPELLLDACMEALKNS